MTTGPFFDKASERRAWQAEQAKQGHDERLATLAKDRSSEYARENAKRLRKLIESHRIEQERKADVILSRNARAAERLKTCNAIPYAVQVYPMWATKTRWTSR